MLDYSGVRHVDTSSELTESVRLAKNLLSGQGRPQKNEQRFKDRLDYDSVLMFCIKADMIGGIEEVTIDATFENRGYLIAYKQDGFMVLSDANAMNASSEVRSQDMQRIHGAFVDSGCDAMFKLYGDALDQRGLTHYNPSGSTAIVPYEMSDKEWIRKFPGIKKVKANKKLK